MVAHGPWHLPGYLAVPSCTQLYLAVPSKYLGTAVYTSYQVRPCTMALTRIRIPDWCTRVGPVGGELLDWGIETPRIVILASNFSLEPDF